QEAKGCSAELARPPRISVAVALEPAKGQHRHHGDDGDDHEDGKHLVNPSWNLVGAPGFEPGISCSQSMRVSQATLRPACWILRLISRRPGTHQRIAGSRIAESSVVKVR